ncbi:MAG TPA: AfsR/SARP family transcriptional regulator [Pseudonocardiaceae bacterium]
MTFRILGDLEVMGTAGPLPMTSHRQRVTLLMLLLAANHEVAIDRLAQAIWDESPPVTAREQIQICVSLLRKRFNRAALSASIVTGLAGYAIKVDPGELDLLVFEDLVASARRSVDNGLLRDAEHDYRAAVDMWPSSGNLPTGSQILDSVAATMTEKRLSTIEEWGTVRLAIGEPDGLVPVLMDLVTTHPLRERLRALLMAALHRCGRRAEALDSYRAGRDVLIGELGIEPGEELRAIQQRILADAPEPVRALAPVPAGRPRLHAVSSRVLSVEDKMGIVLRVLAGDLTVGEAAGDCRQPEQVIETWRRQFLDGGRAGLDTTHPAHTQREQELTARVSELTSALGEAYVELSGWKRKAQSGTEHLALAGI